MPTKTLTITKDAYDALSREKGKEESFSQLVLRLTRSRGTLMECSGLWELTEDDRRIFCDMEASWSRSDRDLKRRVKGK
jgi:predicted CopG family antitoxin